jgi:hypothetical protein
LLIDNLEENPPAVRPSLFASRPSAAIVVRAQRDVDRAPGNFGYGLRASLTKMKAILEHRSRGARVFFRRVLREGVPKRSIFGRNNRVRAVRQNPCCCSSWPSRRGKTRWVLLALSSVARNVRSGLRDSRRAKLDGFALVNRISESGAKRNAWPHTMLQAGRKNSPLQNRLALEDGEVLRLPLVHT